MTIYTDSIISAIMSPNDGYVKSFTDSTKNTSQYKNIMSKYSFDELKELLKKNDNKISKLTSCTNFSECEPYRVGLIKWLFHNAIEKLRIHDKTIEFQYSYYDAAGSTNVTSDYDLTVIAQNAPQISLMMFNIFFELMDNKITLPEVLDVNIYVKGIYLNKSINRHFHHKEIIPVNKVLSSIKDFSRKNKFNIYKNSATPKLFSLQPYSYEDKKYTLIFSLIKLVELKKKIVSKQNPLFNNIYYKNANYIFNGLQKEFANYNIDNRYNFNKKISNKSKNIVKKYNLCDKYGKAVFNDIYGKSVLSKKFYENLCKTGYYSTESYFSPGPVNVVLVEIQMGQKNMKLSAPNYICTIIEILGDLNMHFNTNKKGNDFYIEILDKSKHIYRIIYSLCKLKSIYKNPDLNSAFSLACDSGITNDKLNTFIKKCRGKSNTSGCKNENILNTLIQLKLLGSDVTPANFIDKFNDNIISIIQELLTLFDRSNQTTKRKSRKSRKSRKRKSKKRKTQKSKKRKTQKSKKRKTQKSKKRKTKY